MHSSNIISLSHLLFKYSIYLSVWAWRIINQSILEESKKHEKYTHTSPHINSLCVGHRGERIINWGLLCGHGQKCCHSKWHPCRYCVWVKPKWDPRHYHQHAAGNIDCQQVVGKFSFEGEVNCQTAIFTYGNIISVLYSIKSYWFNKSCNVKE